MTYILLGGPQDEKRGKPGCIHDKLIAELRDNGHKVDYIINGDEMLGALTEQSISKALKVEDSPNIDLIIYDTNLFYPHSSIKDVEDRIERRADAFKKNVVPYLNLNGAPVLVLADEEISNRISDATKQAGFRHFDQPYDVFAVIDVVESMLEEKSRD